MVRTDDTLRDLVMNAERLVSSNYYGTGPTLAIPEVRPAFIDSVLRSKKFPVIAEVKMASPTSSKISEHDPADLISHYVEGGACALSVLTEPNIFKGGLQLLDMAVGSGLPVLMKDFVISREQINAAAAHGASAILMIQSIFSARMVNESRDSLIRYAHENGVEVLLEATDEHELLQSLKSGAEMVGINQRDLRTMTIDLEKGTRLLDGLVHRTKPIIVMSGISRPEQVAALRERGADGVLIGTELASSDDPVARLKSLAVPR